MDPEFDNFSKCDGRKDSRTDTSAYWDAMDPQRAHSGKRKLPIQSRMLLHAI